MLLKMPVGRSLLSTLGLERVDGLDGRALGRTGVVWLD